MEGNKILLNVEERMAYNCLIFSKVQYIDYLEIMLNDISFLSSISLETPQNQFKDLEEIEREFEISLNQGKDYLQRKIKEQGNQVKLEEFESQIEALHQEFRSDRSGEKFNDIQRRLEDISDNVAMIPSTELSDALLQKLYLILNTIKTFKDELKTILDTFVKDDRYEVMVKNLFDQNRLWQNSYGNYNFNPYLNKEKDIEDSRIEYLELERCSYLPKIRYQSPLTKMFTPLVFQDLLFISKDASSISCINSKKEEVFKIPTKGEIVASGAIMFFKNSYYLIVPCKESIQIISEKGIEYEVPYGFFIEDGYEVKSITVFNNVCYVLVSDYTQNKSIVYLITYDFYKKIFSYRTPMVFSLEILSNIFIIHDYDKESFYAGYIQRDHSLHLVDLDSFDSISTFKVSILPIDMGFSTEVRGITIECKYSYPVVVEDGILYYTGYETTDELYLCIVNPLTETEDKILLPKYQKKAQGGVGFMQTFTNIAVGNEKVYLSGIFDHKVLEQSISSKKSQRVFEASIHRGYNFLISYANGPYCINEGELSQNEYQLYSIVGVWNGHIIARAPEKDGYILYIEK